MFEYQGQASIYLEGKEALEAILPLNQNTMLYFVGSPRSAIQIKDHRRLAGEAAKKALNGKNIIQFANIFSTPGNIHIKATDRSAEIEIFDPTDNINADLLWIGVLNIPEVGAQDAYWEIFKPIEEDRIAFAAFIKE